MNFEQNEFDDNIVQIDSETLSQDFDDIDLYGERMIDDESESESDLLFE